MAILKTIQNGGWDPKYRVLTFWFLIRGVNEQYNTTPREPLGVYKVTRPGPWTKILDLHFSTAVWKGLRLEKSTKFETQWCQICKMSEGLTPRPESFIWNGTYILHSKAKFNNQHDMWKWQKHKKTSRTREPRGQLIPNSWQQGCMEQTRQYDKHET